MKIKNLVVSALLLCPAFTFAQYNTVIHLKNGSTVVYNNDQIDSITFETAPETYTINGTEYPMPEIVDLGLPSGTLWASANYGASVPKDNGVNIRMVTFSAEDWKDVNSICETDSDEVRNNMGTHWHTPTTEQMVELKNNCTLTLYDSDNEEVLVKVETTEDGRRIENLSGELAYYRFTGKNGNYIDVPNTNMVSSYFSSISYPERFFGSAKVGTINPFYLFWVSNEENAIGKGEGFYVRPVYK